MEKLKSGAVFGIILRFTPSDAGSIPVFLVVNRM